MILVVYGLFGLSIVVTIRVSAIVVAKGGWEAAGTILILLSFLTSCVLALVAYTRCALSDPG